jgi:hypothetical protein
MKVRADAVLQHAGLTVFVGDIIDLPDVDAINLVSAGLASQLELPLPPMPPEAGVDEEKKLVK